MCLGRTDFVEILETMSRMQEAVTYGTVEVGFAYFFSMHHAAVPLRATLGKVAEFEVFTQGVFFTAHCW